jgi:predicted SAM-dependent methyltransferase
MIHSAKQISARCNVGCGQTPIAGWRNFDNSLSLRLAHVPLLPEVLRSIGLIDPHQHQYMQFARAHRIEYADATQGLPLQAESVEVLYSSHMLEHLDRRDATTFLQEARRVLRSGGILRIAVPDLARLVHEYAASRDADAFVEHTLLTVPRPRGLLDRFRVLVAGHRNHQWMYDGASLTKLILANGFTDVRIPVAGTTRITGPGALDLSERADESVYCEAIRE